MRWQITFHNLISILKETQVLLSESPAFKILIPTGNTILGSPDLQEKPVPFLHNTMLENYFTWRHLWAKEYFSK